MAQAPQNPLDNPNVTQFLDFLGKAEGADYNVIVGGRQFNDFSRHPGVVGLRTRYGPSTAAGKYQITKTTYDDIAPKLGITDFSPQSQDRIAVELLRRRGALDNVKQGRFDLAIKRLGDEWASLPTSRKTQPKRSWEWVRQNLGEPVLSGQVALEGAQVPEPEQVSDSGPSFVGGASPRVARGQRARQQRQLGPERETGTTDQDRGRPDSSVQARFAELPSNYRAALAANYLADTMGDDDESVVAQALSVAGEVGGGTGTNPYLQALTKSEPGDPYKFLKQEEEQVSSAGSRALRRVLPKMPSMRSFADGGSVSKSGVNRLVQARAVPAMPRFQQGGEVEQMTVGTLPPQEEPSAVDTAVSDYLRMQSQLFTDPKAWFQQSGQRLAETIERDPEEFALGFTGAGIGGILKPKGGTFLSGPASNFEAGMDGFKGILEARIRRNPGTPLEDKGKAAMSFFDKQFKNYYQRRLGSQDDSLREAFMRGDFQGKDFLPDATIEGLAQQRQLLATGTPQQKALARQELNQAYDNWTDIHSLVRESTPAPDLASLQIRQRKLAEQGTRTNLSDIYPSTRDIPDVDLDPRAFRAFKEGDVAYDAAAADIIEGRMRYLDDYLTTLSPQQIRNIRFEDAMIQAEKYHDLLERAAKRQLSPKELFSGREKVIDVGDRRWSDIKDTKALEVEAQFMDHCIGGAGYCEELTSGVGRHFSLQDVKTGEPHVTMSAYRSPFSDTGKHVIIRQIKGKSNSAPEKYFPEIEAFLNDYEKKFGRIYITEKRNHIPPAFRSPEYTEIPRAYRGFE